MLDIFDLCRENRVLHAHAVEILAREGITQFVQIGSSFPLKERNTYTIAQGIDPDTRVVYVDPDPLITEYAKGLLKRDISTTVICGDIRVPDTVFGNHKLTDLIDFSKPVSILIMLDACFFADKEIQKVMRAIRTAMLPGSYIAITHETSDRNPWNASATNDVVNI